MKRLLFSFFFILCTSVSFAYDVEVDDIYYNLVTKMKTPEVTYKGDTYDECKSYSGSITIPSKIFVSGTEYSVTSIGNDVFYHYYDLTSINIPNSVKNIGRYAISK